MYVEARKYCFGWHEEINDVVMYRYRYYFVRPVQGLSLMLVEPTEQTLYRRLCGTLARKGIFIL
jgi:hypothetical protein